MRNVAAAALSLLLAGPVLSGAAVAESLGEKTGVNSLIGVAPTAQDFVSQAVISNMFEIKSSELAVQKGDETTKSMAQKFINDHKEAGDELKVVLNDAGRLADKKLEVKVPDALDSTHQSKIDKLKDLSGEDFVKQYNSDQVTAHKNAVDLFKRYGEGGDNEPLKAYARKTLPHLEEHLKLAEAAKK